MSDEPDAPLIDGLSDFLGLRWEAVDRTRLTLRPALMNPGSRLTGPVCFAMVDYTMGSTLFQHTEPDEAIATINIAINYIATAHRGDIVCTTQLDRRTRVNAVLRGEVSHEDGRLLATAVGSFTIFPRRVPPPTGA